MRLARPGGDQVSNEPLFGPGKDIRAGAMNIGLWVLGIAFGRFAGLSFLIPFVGAALALFVLKRVIPNAKATAVQLIAVQVGHLVWMSFALTVPGGLAQVGLDLVVIGALLLWFAIKQSPASAIALFVVQSLALASRLRTSLLS
jgi:hypothetical protein